MIVRVSTELACSASELWQKICLPKSLQFVASPMLSFAPVELGALDGEWQVGRDYLLKIAFLHCIPLGHHSIKLIKIDRQNNRISSREKGSLVAVWNHEIFFTETSPNVVSYTDEIELQAGWLTLLVWAFAQLFYRHRQRRWKTLLKSTRAAKAIR